MNYLFAIAKKYLIHSSFVSKDFVTFEVPRPVIGEKCNSVKESRVFSGCEDLKDF